MRRVAISVKKMIILSLVYMLTFGTAEFINRYMAISVSIILYFLILFSLIINSISAVDNAQRSFWLALGLVPLIRIVSIGMPVMFDISRFVWYIAISIPVVVGIIIVMRTLKYSSVDIGFKMTNPIFQLMIALAGLFLGAIGYFILKPQPWIDRFNIQAALFPSAVLLISSGFVEEIAFRGVIQHAAGVIGSIGWIFIAMVYAVLQIGRIPPVMCAYVFGICLFFGYAVKKGGSIIGVSLAHGLFNIGLYLIFPYVLK